MKSRPQLEVIVSGAVVMMNRRKHRLNARPSPPVYPSPETSRARAYLRGMTKEKGLIASFAGMKVWKQIGTSLLGLFTLMAGSACTDVGHAVAHYVLHRFLPWLLGAG